ncbi:RDD family protein [Flammeovirga sp. SJP92]|uniref:RDD family protein n=1 Tax=Flammeovirga sp. SJP92 TaxID=1775430 RepID=UPI000787B81F|nr:RDD family protein [Flammeovirga sp. SJP92]KXX66796.1 hypothetical protein AVL50_30145 [Flammeovirga sp. SJP92]
MNKENFFTNKLRLKSNSDLQYYIDNKEKFQVEAVQAAIWELELRGLQSEKSEEVQEEINAKRQAKIKANTNQHGIPVRTVSRGIRFVHFLIDGFILQGLTYLVNLIPVMELSQLFTFLLYPLYCIFFEYYFQLTPGKLISDTIVVDKQGEKPDLRTIILRTFTRLVPFEPFSCLGSNSWGWHDRWTKTYVIQKKDLATLREKSGLEKIDLKPRPLDKVGYMIIAVFLATIIGGVILSKSSTAQLSQESLEFVQQLDSKDAQNILGTWNTYDTELGEVNFISAQVVIIKDINLIYKIENRVLTMTDNDSFVKNFVIVESSPTQLKLRDTDNPMKELIWRK